jgi:hypothetical protein
MKYLRLLCLLGLLSQFSFTSVQAQQASTSTEKVFAALENQWLKSQKSNNPDLASPLLAGKFIYTSEDGQVMDEAHYLADAKATKYTFIEYKNLQIAVFGETAIVRGEAKYAGTDSAGKDMDSRVRFTDTWVKMTGDKWQCVASHTSSIKK